MKTSLARLRNAPKSDDLRPTSLHLVNLIPSLNSIFLLAWQRQQFPPLLKLITVGAADITFKMEELKTISGFSILRHTL